MSSPDLLEGCTSGTARHMATDVTIRLVGRDDARALSVVAAALQEFGDVEAACTRFDPASPLMSANANPFGWCAVPKRCFDAVSEAHRAYQETGGRFDPRVLGDLVAMGYRATLPFSGGPVVAEEAVVRRRLALPPWRPQFRVRAGTFAVRLGGLPIDLGGIGKGLAVRWAADLLAAAGADVLIEAGGDCMARGHAPGGGPWHVGVEDPAGDVTPVAVLGLSDLAATTSSTRVRHWTAAGRSVHHLVDPRTGLPGGRGMRSVTVVGPDPAMAEVWSKTLFLAGRHAVATEAEQHGIAACWVADDGVASFSTAIEPYVLWRRS